MKTRAKPRIPRQQTLSVDLGRFRCLHCLIAELTDRVIERGFVKPDQAAHYIAQALGDLLGHFPDPEERGCLLEVVIEEIRQRTDATVVRRLRSVDAVGHA